MLRKLNRAFKKILRLRTTPREDFHSNHYQRHNRKRLEHLASLGLGVRGATVLEVGAGIGDHTPFFLERRCKVLTTDARAENVEELQKRYPDVDVRQLDLDAPDPNVLGDEMFDIVYCYGLLYHLSKPDVALDFMAAHCSKLLFLETSVSFGDDESVNLCDEIADRPSQSISGQGCRPTRRWIVNRLRSQFEFVYLPTTQPDHEQFPLDWSEPQPASSKRLARAVFVASRQKLDGELLVEDIPMQQVRV